MKHIACSGIGIVLFLGVAGLSAGAQNQAPSAAQDSSSGSSLGAYARQVRKDPGTSSRPKVYDNDNLPKDDKLSVVGTPSPSDSADAKPAESDNTTSTNATPAAPAAGEVKPGTETKTGEVKPPTAVAKTAEEDDAAKQAAWKQWGDKIAGAEGSD